MALELRANTAVDVLIGPFVDDGDGDTADTDATLVVELSKNGQALATKNEGTNPSHDAAGTVDGYYNCQLDTTDTNTEGNMVLVVHHADDLPVRHEYNVLAEAAWDSKYVAKDDGFMDVNIKTIGRVDTTETEATNLEAACAAYSVTRGLTGTALPAAVADAGGGVPISDAGGLDLDAILADTNELQADDVPTLIAALPTAVEIQAEMEENGASILDTLRDDWADGGRLDLILDIIAADTTTDIPATIATVAGYLDTEIAAIVTAVVTNATGADVATDVVALRVVVDALDALTKAAGDGDLAAVLADTNELQADTYPTTIAALQTDLDTLTDAAGEPAQGAPAVSASLVDKVAYIYKFLRNKLETDATEIRVYNDAGAVVDHKSTISDDGTDFTRGEFVSGP